MLITLIIITALFIVGLVVSIAKHNGDGIGANISGLFITALLGWVFLGLFYPSKQTTSIRTATVLKEPSSIHLSVEGNIIKTYTDVPTYTFLSNLNSVDVIETKHFNLYGGHILSEWKFPEKK